MHKGLSQGTSKDYLLALFKSIRGSTERSVTTVLIRINKIEIFNFNRNFNSNAGFEKPNVFLKKYNLRTDLKRSFNFNNLKNQNWIYFANMHLHMHKIKFFY